MMASANVSQLFDLAKNVDSIVHDLGSGVLYIIGWNYGTHHIVEEFDVNQDLIDLSAFSTDYDSISLYNDIDGNAVIDLMDLNQQIITLQNVNVSQLTAKNITSVEGNFAAALKDSALQIDVLVDDSKKCFSV